MGLPKDQKEWMETQTRYLQELSESMKSMVALQKDIKAILTTMEAKQMPHDYCINLRSNVEEIKTKVSTYIQQYVDDKNKNIVVSEGYKYRKKIAKEWFRCLNARKIAYYNRIR